MIENAPADGPGFHGFAGLTAIVTGRSPILKVEELRTCDFRRVAACVAGVDGWVPAVSQATRLPGNRAWIRSCLAGIASLGASVPPSLERQARTPVVDGPAANRQYGLVATPADFLEPP